MGKSERPSRARLDDEHLRREVMPPANPRHDLKASDRWFVNDTFWMMMPLHLSWQEPQHLDVEDHGIAHYPLGQALVHRDRDRDRSLNALDFSRASGLRHKT